jgi:pantoate--beta-alanine ligase
VEVVRTFAAGRVDVTAPVVLVPTMGALHEGHLSLVRHARSLGGTVLVSLFVNPLQFDEQDDLDRYPRDGARDARLVEAAGCDVLFAPSLAEMYPTTPQATVVMEGVTERMEGAHRPGHFSGVATVVAKLLAGLRPDVAVFGRKDAQQLAVVTRMAADLSFPAEIVGRPTVREPDGLALSSRNVFLDAAERHAAVALSRGLMAAADAAQAGERAGAVLEGIVRDEIDRIPMVRLEYAELADATEAARLAVLDRPAFLAVAARVGAIRLIDNVWFEAPHLPDRGEWLEQPSSLAEGGG